MKPLAFAAILLGFASLCQSSPVQAQTDAEVEITLDTTQEEKARQQLKRLLREYDLDPWVFTQKVRIKSYATPHSHPVLTLNTRNVNDDARALSTFLHEQAHWFEEENEDAVERAIETLRQRYPDPPDYEEIGTRSEYSTYLHLIVNWSELDGTTEFVGEEKAREILAGKGHYEWVYEKVLRDTEEIGAVLAEHNLIITPGAGIVVEPSDE